MRNRRSMADHLGFSHQVKELFGLTGKDNWPTDGLPPIKVEGYTLWVEPLDTEYRGAKRSTHRCLAKCDKCGKVLSAGRTHQHVCKPMSLAKARRTVAQWQCRIGRTRHDEYVVTPLWDAREETKYYTNDIEDAVGTAYLMWVRHSDPTVVGDPTEVSNG